MKNHFRLFILLLVFALVLSCFAGCSSQPEASQQITQSTEETDPTNKGSVSADPGISTDRSFFTTGYFDDFAPAEISSRHTLQPVQNFSPAAQKERTILIYMVGSDLESGRYGFASQDLEEICGSGLDTEKTNLVVYTGGAVSWKLNIPSNQNTLLQLDGDSLYIVGATQEAANMGNPRVLADFMNYGVANFPAESYSLIFWDHGGGPIRGYGLDEQFRDILQFHELQWAMENSPFRTQKLELLGFDACLMATAEIADLFAPYAHYMVASEETEPGAGWDYNFLRTYNHNSTTVQVADQILATYAASMDSADLYTLSCLDLSRISNFNDALSALFLRMAEGCLTGDYNTIARQRSGTKRFGMGKDEYDLVDLGHMAQMLQGIYPHQTANLQNALSDLVVNQVSNIKEATGVCAYYPYNGQNNFVDFGEGYGRSYYDNQGYQLFLQAFASKWIPGRQQLSWDAIKPQDQTPATEPTVPETTEAPTTEAPATEAPTEPTLPQGDDISFGQIDPNETYLNWQIDPASRTTYNSATYTILRYDRNSNTYTPILSDCQAIVDENGMIYVPADPQVFTITTDASADTAVWIATQAESTQSKSTYYADCTLLASGDVVIGDTQPVQILFSQREDGTVVIERIVTRNEDAMLFGKNDVDIFNWSSVGILFYSHFLTNDTAGNLLPASQWETDGSMTVEYVPYNQSIQLNTSRISQLEGDYYLELSLTDTQGQSVNVAYEALKVDEFSVYEYPVTWGTLTFHVYSDHAELVSYTENFDAYGGDQPSAMEIPQMVQRQPVTVIGTEAFMGSYSFDSVQIPSSVRRIEEGAFRACYNLKQVTTTDNLRYIGAEAFFACPMETISLPSSLEVIGWRAFAATKLTQIAVPENVSLLGTGTFYGCQALTAIDVAEGNRHFQSVDGVLFSADGKTLLSYPAGKGSSYTVPAGTEILAAESFRWCEALTDVTIPEGVTKIAPLAFCDTLNLTAINLPASLQTIGSAAFGKGLGSVSVSTVDIQLGQNLVWIGDEAFNGYLVTGFTVEEGNQHYSAQGAYLMNASGTELIRVANQLQGVATVPEPVNHIATGAFTECSALTEVVLPDSVTSIAAYADLPKTLEKLTVGAGVLNWNNLNKCADIRDIQLSSDNPNYAVVDGNIYDKNVTKLYLFRSQATTYTMPDTVTEIVSGTFAGAGSLPLERIVLSANLSTMPDGAFGACATLTEIACPESNQTYTTKDGLLYSKDGTKLIAMPMGKTGTVRIADGTVEIARGAIYDSNHLQAEHIIFPEGLIAIREYNLQAKAYGKFLTVELPASLTEIHPKFLGYIWSSDLLIKCPADSVAAQFAAAKNLPMEN